MNEQSAVVKKARDLISKDQLDKAFELLANLFNNSPYLNEVIQQTGRFNELEKQVRLGILSTEKRTVALNQIRLGLLELIDRVEIGGSNAKVAQEIIAFEKQNPELISIKDSGASTIYGNINISGEVAAGRDIQIGKKPGKKKKSFWKFW